MYSRVRAQCGPRRRHGARPQNDPPRRSEPGGDRRRGRMPSRGRPRRHADRDRLRPRGGRDLGRGGRGDLRRQGAAGDQPADRPCSRHRGGARAWPSSARRPRRWPARSGPGRSLWSCPSPRPARISLLARAGLDTRGDSRAVARNRAGADRGGGRPPRGALRQPVRRREPDDRGPCRRRSRRQGRLDPRRRAMPPWPRVDDRRLPRRPAPIAASGRDHAGGDRIRARLAGRRSSSAARAAPNAPGQLASHYAPKAELRLGAASASADEAALDFGGALEGAAPRARGSIFRRPETSSRPRRISFPICARSTPPASRGSRSRRSPRMGLARRSTIGSAARPRPGSTAE